MLKMYWRSVALLVFFVSSLMTHVSSHHHYQIFCNASQPEKYDCLTLFDICCTICDRLFGVQFFVSKIFITLVHFRNLLSCFSC